MRDRLSMDKFGDKMGDDVIPLRRSGGDGWFSKGRLIWLAVLIVLIGLGVFLSKALTKHMPWDKATTAAADKEASFGSVQDGVVSVSGRKNGTVPVVVAKAELKDMPFEIHNIGNVEAFSVVNVIAQVGGELTKVFFTQGQDVGKGDLLFKIDSRPYEAQLAQAEANVERDKSQIKAAVANLDRDMAIEHQNEAALRRDQATRDFAVVEVQRYGVLVQQGAVSHEQADQMQTNSDTAGATVLSDKAAIENAKAVVASDQAAVQTAKSTLVADQAAAANLRVQLGYTEIRSPVNGRTGALNVYQGNVVRANDTTPLITINQIEPIYVTFSVPETHLADIRKAQAKGSLRVTARLNGDKKQLQTGQLSFVDNNVDKTTGTIRLRATFQNNERMLWPGQFVDVVLSLPGSAPAVVVPSRAVQSDQSGQSVYIVKRDGTVAYVPVEVQRTYGEFSVISKGLNLGDTVVIDGQMKLTPGTKIKIVDPGPEQPSSS
jgi:membrane fusion protein, multidrug efflux system